MLASLCLSLGLWLPGVRVHAAEVVLQDDMQRTVRLPQPAKRVVVLAPHLAEMVFAIGAGDKLVGAVSYSDYPQAAQQVPRVGTYKNFSAEAILRLRPDLVLAWQSGNGLQRVEPIIQLGIPVYFTEPRTLEDIALNMQRIAELTGVEENASQQFLQTLNQLRANYASQPPLSVFYQVWNQPLQTLNGEHLLSDVITLCGGNNVFGDANVLAPQVSVESVLRLDPQVIVASGMGEARPEWLDEWRRWPSLQAVRNEQLKFIPPDIIQRHTPRVLQGAAQLCEHLQTARGIYYPAANATATADK
ncbi:ABC transporter substrate-binding protein [Pseudomaricurvus sp. HS19]|nr:ABC transporter substrate-binding protein [Pseudomaricurvus sp. HS19]